MTEVTEDKRAKRKAQMAKMYEDLKEEKQAMIERKVEHEREWNAMDDMDPMKNVIMNKIRVIEEKLTTEYY